jgi:hypothetical protein
MYFIPRLYLETTQPKQPLEIFDAVHADSQIPKFLVWLQRQVSRENVLCR